MNDFLVSPVRETRHDGSDDLLSAGLGLAGLRAAPAAFTDPDQPTPQELRRRAIHTSWAGIADLGPLGGYGELYGSTQHVPGREFQAFARIPGVSAPHRVLLQVPDAFDVNTRCLVVTASSGSRGIYGAIALAGAAGLPRGCAVAYTDKGAGSGYFDPASQTGVALDGTRASLGGAQLEFVPQYATSADGEIAVKHAHSGDHPEADRGLHVQQAAAFGLAMLDRAFPEQAPFTAENSCVIALGLSNGGGAVLRAAGTDTGLFDAVIALAPNIHVTGQGRALYDYASEAALWMPCALLDSRFDEVPFARSHGAASELISAHVARLQAQGLLSADRPSADAIDHLHASGWTDAAIACAASSTQFDLWRSITATYASAYLRRPLGDMPCGYRFEHQDAQGRSQAASSATRAAWWSDASGIPPGAGVVLAQVGDATVESTVSALHGLRELWAGGGADALSLRAAVNATAAELPRTDLPIVVIHGDDDGLIPSAFSGAAYVKWLRDNGREPIWWPIAHAQHFDAFLAFPGFGDRYVPLLPYAYAVFDEVLKRLRAGQRIDSMSAPLARPRGAGELTRGHLRMA